MNLTEIINGITQSECVNCKFGRALITLRDLRDSLDAPKETAAPDVKLQRKTAVSKPAKTGSTRTKPTKTGSTDQNEKTCNGCGQSLPIHEFPKNDQCRGGHSSTCKACIYARAKKRAAAKKAPAASPKLPQPTEAGIVRCKLCDYRAIDSVRLASHMRTNHGAQGL